LPTDRVREFLNRFFKMKPGNKLKIQSLNNDWHDNDTIMLHACFELLADCIENEKLLSKKLFDLEHSAKATKEKTELKFLYKWWKKRIKKVSKSVIVSAEEKQYKEDNAMLIRLIKIRHRLWT
jgi:hypothetical protein